MMKKHSLDTFVDTLKKSPDKKIKAILGKKTSFTEEIKSFYGLETTYEFGALGDPFNGRHYHLLEEKDDTTKKNQAPTELIKILNPLSEDVTTDHLKLTRKGDLDLEHLTYDAVRSNYQAFKKNQRNKALIGAMIALSGTVITIMALKLKNYLGHDATVLLGSGGMFTSLIGVMTVIGRSSREYPNERKFGPLWNFVKLSKAAKIADYILE